MIKAGVACSGLPAQTNMFSGPRHIVSGAHERLWLFRSWPRATSFRARAHKVWRTPGHTEGTGSGRVGRQVPVADLEDHKRPPSSEPATGGRPAARLRFSTASGL